MDVWRRIGAENNARWCDLVVRSHGGRGVFSHDAWTSPTRTPPLFPDAVSLVPSLSLDDLLSRIDISPGCTIKDSFASLDLATHGFRVLFDAQWIRAAPTQGRAWDLPRDWTQVTEPDELDTWEQARRGNDGPARLFKPTLLSDGIAVLGRKRGGRFIAGGIVNRCERAAGVSNVLTAVGDPLQTWSALAENAWALFPGLPLVGYEGGEDLTDARISGFATVGGLRVWIAGPD
jgi:hypothetical protein